MFSIVTVESSTRIPTASASPPSVMVFSVSPRKYSTTSEVRIDSGMEIMTTRVERQEPRNSRIIRAGQCSRDGTLAQHAGTDCLTRWTGRKLVDAAARAAPRARAICRAFCTPLTTATVEALPFLMTLSRTERRPFSRTMFCCTSPAVMHLRRHPSRRRSARSRT